MKKLVLGLALSSVLLASCSNDDDAAVDPIVEPTLTIPSAFTSDNFDANVSAENTVINELSDLATALNDAEANAQTTTVETINYPTTLSSVTVSSYSVQITDWLEEAVDAANSADGFQNPGFGNSPAEGQEGGLLGSRLLNEHGLELEQMIEKGSFGAALYNHAVTVINGDLSNSGAIDKLVEIHGADITFNPSETTAAATYSRRRSNLEAETGFFFDIKKNLITAKAAIEAGSDFNEERDNALTDYLQNWEKSNFATVIFYCNATKNQLTAAFELEDGAEKDAALGNALHAYAEGVGFTHGFKGVSNKIITDAQIDSILEKLLAVDGQDPESHRFLNETTLLANLDAIITEIQGVYGFTDAEVASFYENNNP